MLPYVTVFGRVLPLYSLLAIAGLCLALLWMQRTAPNDRVQQADLTIAFVCGAAGMLLGAKLLSVLTQLHALAADLAAGAPAALLVRKYLAAGFVFYGGLYGALLGAWLYIRRAHMDFDLAVRHLLPAVPLIHAFGRLGCFATGCCYGKATASPLGIAFHRSQVAPNGVPLLPVQLWEAAAEALLFLLLTHRIRHGARNGRRLLALYLLCYAALRFVLEFWRGDAYRGFLGALSVSQVISLATLAFGAWLRRRGGRIAARQDAHTTTV